MTTMRVAVAQLPNVVGDLDGNAERLSQAMSWAEAQSADVLVVPELALTGYPVADLALDRGFVTDARAALEQLAAASGTVVSVVGTVERVPPQQTWDSRPRDVAISCALLSAGDIRGLYHKVLLPTQGGFDEGRTFAPGREPDAVWRIGDVTAGVCICEDLWSGDGPPEAQSAAGARIILAPNASPYWRGKADGRHELAQRLSQRNGVPLVYVNGVGGQDELVFDGGSLITDGDGALVYRAAEFRPDEAVVDVDVAPERAVRRRAATVHTRPLPHRPAAAPAGVAPRHERVAGVWAALVTGVRDFAHGNGFDAAVLGLSGGIDAAVTAAVAADALGADRVLGVAMPAADTPPEDTEAARRLAAALGIVTRTVPLAEAAGALPHLLGGRDDHDGSRGGTAALSAHVRAAVLAAVGDAEHRMVLGTSNKTELSVGQATVPVSAVGMFAPLRDCPKTLLYELAAHRNRDGAPIPTVILDQPTTAQRDDDAWPPPYGVLDDLVERYIEHGDDLDALIAAGFDAELTAEVLRRVNDAELERRQFPPGVKVTARAFSHDRRVPITNRWRPHRRAGAAAGIDESQRSWRGVGEEGPAEGSTTRLSTDDGEHPALRDDPTREERPP